MVKTLTGRPVGRPREFDEEQVLTAAMEAFWRHGYEATSLVDLTRATGLNKASLYRVFGDKHQLFLAALKNYSDIEFRETTTVICASASPLTNLRAVVQKVCEDAGSDKGCLMINSMVETAPHDAEVKQLLQEFGMQRLQAIQGMISQAQATDEIRPELDAYKLAVSLMIAFAGSAAMIKGFMPGEQIIENLKDLIDSWTSYDE
ncbi:TetR/AcrR family transcriptional regulator [Gammaproteobacteria bacterium]|nr:TetR/AcrR family transcriptional regulator [Gammaproteobacteria bacterium]